MELQTIIGLGFFDIRNNQGQGKCYQPSRRPRLLKLNKTLIIPEITKPNLLIVLVYIVLKKIRTDTASHGTQFNIALGNHALRA